MPPREEQQLLLESKNSSLSYTSNSGEENPNKDHSILFHNINNTTNDDEDSSTVLVLTMDQAMERLGYGRFQQYLLWAAGLCLMADGLEVLLLSFLTLVLRTSSDWNLTDTETNSIVASVFVGALFGSLILGRLADRYGRKPVFTGTAALIALFGVATGLTSRYATLLVCRLGVGFGVGGLTVPFDTLTEFLPKSHRGHHLLAVEFFWTTGTMMVVVLAYFTLGQGELANHNNDNDDNTDTMDEFGEFWRGWRLFVILCAVPCIFSTLWGMYSVPESPRWLMTTQKDPHGAIKVLREAAVVNGKNPMEVFPIHTRLVAEESGEGDIGIQELFRPRWRRTTFFLWGTSIGFAFLYYGGVIATTLVFADSHSVMEDGTENGEHTNTYHFDYGSLFVSNSAEIVGTFLIVLTVDTVGRIPIQTGCYLLGGICVLILCLLASGDNQDQYQSVMVALSFGTRMLMMAASCTTWVSTAEIFTTDIRSTGHSTANAVARIGGFFVPYVIAPSSQLTTIGYSMFGMACFTSFCAWNLPETKGLDLGSATASNKHSRMKTDTNSSALDV